MKKILALVLATMMAFAVIALTYCEHAVFEVYIQFTDSIIEIHGIYSKSSISSSFILR